MGGSATTADPTPDEQADLAALHMARLVSQEIAAQRARRTAKQLLDEEEAARTFREPPYRLTLVEELAMPDEPITYTVDKVLPTGGNVLLTAQFKAGKTTLVNELTRCLVDREDFLGRFPTGLAEGRVALFNYEVDERQYRRWLRDAQIVTGSRVVVLNLRGYRLPVTSSRVEDWVVRWLAEREVKVWAVDPFARAFVGCGVSENDNTEVGRFLDTLDVIKARAGVSELILPTHTGRAEFEDGQERARGATRLDDWADVRWFLTKDDQDGRFFRATGRDVSVEEEKLSFDPERRRLRLGGGDRAWERRRRVADAVLAVVRAQPGVTSRDLRAGVRDLVKGASNDAIDAAVTYAESHYDIKIERGKVGTPNRHFPTGIGGVFE